MTQGNFNFNGVDSADFGVYLHGGGTYAAPARIYEAVKIPGRNGTLTLDGGAYEDVEHSYYAFIPADFDSNLAGLRNALMGVIGNARLEDSFHPDEFYLARYMRGLEPDVAPDGVAGDMTITFTRDPRRFLKSGDEGITIARATDTITNPTPFESKPLIKVERHGSTTFAFAINNVQINVSGLPSGVDAVYIDCDAQECYNGSQNLNAYVRLVTGDFPTLLPGSNQVDNNLNADTFVIYPRWFNL